MGVSCCLIMLVYHCLLFVQNSPLEGMECHISSCAKHIACLITTARFGYMRLSTDSATQFVDRVACVEDEGGSATCDISVPLSRGLQQIASFIHCIGRGRFLLR